MDKSGARIIDPDDWLLTKTSSTAKTTKSKNQGNPKYLNQSTSKRKTL